LSFLLLGLGFHAGPAAAADGPAEQQPQYGWREVWAGTDASHDVWLLYTGVTLAPWSSDIYADGFRIRTAGGYGEYNYEGCRKNFQVCFTARDPPPQSKQHFNATFTYSEVLVGYHQRFGELTAKAFVGIAAIDHNIRPRDAYNAVGGVEYGVKGVVELWLNLGSVAWTSVDLGYTTAHETASARARLGWRVLPTFSIGPEARYDSNAQADSGRGGVFVRYEWLGCEVSAAAGYSGDMTGGLTKDMSPYGTFNILFQY
jgi:hypothetical protein